MKLQPNASVSVVIPCYRCTDTIVRAIKSVADQTLKPYEVILVEDCSGDDTLDKLYDLQNKYELDWIKVIALSENSGPGTARNIGWNASKQDYIAFLDSDDSWHPDKLKIQCNWMIQHPDVDVCGHVCSVLNGAVASVEVPDELKVTPIRKIDLLLANRFSTPSVMLKRSIPIRFEEGSYFAEDFFLWQRLSCQHYKIIRLELILGYLHKEKFGGSGLSGQLWEMERGELRNYLNLWKEDCINVVAFVVFSMVSLTKFFKRLLVVGAVRCRSHL